MAYKSQPTITRPANATPYNAGDVVGGAFEFTGLGSGPFLLLLTNAALRIDVAAIPAGMTSFRLHLYSLTPPSALADNAPWDLPAGDRDAYLNYIDLGSPADVGSTLYAEVDSLNRLVRPGAAGLFAYLVTNGAFTPAGNSEVYVPTLYAIGV